MTIFQIICLIVVLLLAVVGGFFIVKKSKKHSLLKWISLFILLSIALTWIFESSGGFYYSTEFSGRGLYPQGVTDIPNIIYNAIYLAMDKIIFLLSLGAFYGVLTMCKGYKKLVVTIAEKFKGKEVLFALLSSLIITLMTTFFRETFAVLIFVPFIISIALSLKLDKISAFAITFGSMLVGILGPTYGTEGLIWFNTYISLGITEGILYRLVVLIIAFVLFNFFTVLHIQKVLNKKNANEEVVDPFKVEKIDKKASIVLPIIGMVVLLIITILGFVDWSTNFNIKIFGDFHNWLIGIQINGFPIVKYILGNLAIPTSQRVRGVFGYWDLYVMSAILMVASIVIALFGRIHLDDFINDCKEGIKKLAPSIGLFIGVYMVMIAAYICLYVPTIINFIGGLSSEFNPYITTLSAFISNVFYSDLGLTGYAVAPYFTGLFADNVNIIQTIFVTMYGFVQLCLPTSAVLLIGLSYLKIDYKTWIKYIWIFAIGILVILLVLFTIMTYI